MKDIYETIEIQFYKDIKESEKEFLDQKNAVEEIMKQNSVEYALELVENQKRSYYEEAYIKGYTLNLIIKKVDLHYVLKLLDQNNIGFFASEEEKWNAVKENEIDYEEEYEETNEEIIEEESSTNYRLDEEEIKRQTEQGNTFVRVFFSIFFFLILFLDFMLIYWCYTINNQKYLEISKIFTVIQIIFFIYFLGKFKNKPDRL